MMGVVEILKLAACGSSSDQLERRAGRWEDAEDDALQTQLHLTSNRVGDADSSMPRKEARHGGIGRIILLEPWRGRFRL